MTTSRSSDRQVGPYRIERELGRGGMGVVYLATRADREYRKQVAIKLIHGQRGDELASRFRAERQILANLEHPNIARLLDGGTTPEGDPYIAMEYVRDGSPIDVWSRAPKRTIRQKLEKFIAICSAVQHAHQHLIVHRDLKPGNILVTPEGDVKLLDFGIARPLAPLTREMAAAASGPVVRSMTPEYASPEQQTGLSVGTASDIYSLGVILFEMLTGTRPHQSALADHTATLWSSPPSQVPSVYHGGILTLERMPASIPADLAAIVLMALREDPDRRYGSAGEMRLDVQRYLEGRPVAAHPNHLSYRFLKYVRRHKLLSIVFALLIASLNGGMIATRQQAELAEGQRLLAEQHAREAEGQRLVAEAERRLADAKTEEAHQLRAFAEQQMKIADREQARALEQRDQTMKLATTLAVDLDRSISRLAGSLPTRRLLISKAIEALEQVYQTSPDDPKVLLELAGAYQSLGLIQRSRFASSLGDSEGALKSYKRSLDFAKQAMQVLNAAPNHTMRGVTSDIAAGTLAGAYFGFGDVSTINGNHAEALQYYFKSVPYAERAAQAVPLETKRTRIVLSAYKKTGDMYRELGRLDEAEAYFSKADQAGIAFAKAFPDSISVAHDRVVSCISFGLLLESRNKKEAALAKYKESIHASEQGVAASPHDALIKRDLFVSYSRAGIVEYDLERDADAHADFEKALVIAKERFESENGNLQAVYDLADAHYHVSQTLTAAGRRDEAKVNLLASREMAHRAATIDPNAEQTKEFVKRVEDALSKQ